MAIKVRYKAENDKPKNAVIYLRVSTEEQVDNFSLGTQEEICKKEAVKRGYEIIKTFREEGRSAKTITGRPALLEMLKYCKQNKKLIGAVMVYRLDRLSRQTQDYLNIRKQMIENQITLISASEPTGNSPTEKLLETILASFAQHDNEVRGERAKNGLRARFLSGLSTGPVPMGYLNMNGYPVKDPVTYDKVKAAWELMLTGTKTLREMAAIMSDWGLGKTLKGKKYPLYPQQANRMFRNKFYMGLLTSTRYPEEVVGQHVPMVTQQQFYQVQAILDGRNTNTNGVTVRRVVDTTEFPLRRIMRCSQCGTPFTAAWSKGRNGKYGYYFCRNRCGQSSVKVSELHDVLDTKLDEIKLTPDGIKMLVAFLRQNYLKRTTLLQKKKATAELELHKLHEVRQTLVQKNLDGIYSDELFKEQNALLETKMKDLLSVQDTTLFTKYNLEQTATFIEEKLSDLKGTYTDASLEQKKALLGSIFPTGMAWEYPGISNRNIGPIYQDILHFTNHPVSFGRGDRTRTCDRSHPMRVF
jgi:site-specific DNA recombinase